jgi:hypothetical protein
LTRKIWNDVHDNGITIDEQFCRDDWVVDRNGTAMSRQAVW